MQAAREAKLKDLPRMEAAAREFYASSGVVRSTGAFDPERFRALWAGLLEAGTGVIFVLEDAGEIVGALGGVAYPDPYSGSAIASEMFWFVRAAFRGRGMELYRAFEGWARAKGCAQMQMVFMVDSMPEKLSAVYRRLGFRPAEIRYVKEVV